MSKLGATMRRVRLMAMRTEAQRESCPGSGVHCVAKWRSPAGA
jgi:hypothetical protein